MSSFAKTFAWTRSSGIKRFSAKHLTVFLDTKKAEGRPRGDYPGFPYMSNVRLVQRREPFLAGSGRRSAGRAATRRRYVSEMMFSNVIGTEN